MAVSFQELRPEAPMLGKRRRMTRERAILERAIFRSATR
jgi:hypothetical protein